MNGQKGFDELYRLHVFFVSPSRPSRQAALSILQHKPKDHGPAVHKNCGTAAACRRYRRMNGIVGHIGSGRDYALQGPMMKDKEIGRESCRERVCQYV